MRESVERMGLNEDIFISVDVCVLLSEVLKCHRGLMPIYPQVTCQKPTGLSANDCAARPDSLQIHRMSAVASSFLLLSFLIFTVERCSLAVLFFFSQYNLYSI